ncbi:MAG: hypothetical protein J1F35_06070 [Erysipelotrichales bacterium]|nr:hypothetical protein [Erysipelotrichales bacterium]
MTTEQALDFAYENPYTCITTEDIYEYGEQYFYYDNKGNLKNENSEIIDEEYIYNNVENSSKEDFNDWIEIDKEVSEADENSNYDYGDYDYDE